MLIRMLTVAVIAGALAGIAATAIQLVWSVPVILQAELYETGILNPDGSVAAGAMDAFVAAHTSHMARNASTFLANVINGVGLGMLMVAVFAFRPVSGWREGLLWGLAGFLAFNAAPAIGLPPELPGTQTAPLQDRQLWWLGTVAATSAGLGLISFARKGRWCLTGFALLFAPHIVGAPQPDAPIAVSPLSLQHEFLAASLVTSAILWLVLGGAAGYLSTRLSKDEDQSDSHARLNARSSL